MEHTFVVIKPDAVRRGLVGKVLSRFEDRGFTICEARFTKITEEQARRLYSVHKHKGFYDNLVDFMTKGPSLVAILGRHDAVMTARRLTGAMGPDGLTNVPGSIRGDFATGVTDNVVHSSDVSEQAAYEASSFFEEDLIREYWP